MESPGNLKDMDSLESAKDHVRIKKEPPELEPTSYTFDQLCEVGNHEGYSSGSGIYPSLLQSKVFSSSCSLRIPTMIRNYSEFSGMHSSTIDGDPTITGYRVPGFPQGALMGTASPIVHAIGFKLPEDHQSSFECNGQEMIDKPQNKSQSYLSNLLRNGNVSSSLFQNTVSSEISRLNTAVSRKDSELCGERKRTNDFKESIVSYSHDSHDGRKEEEMPMDLTVPLKGVLQGALLGTESTSVLSCKIKVEPEEHDTASSRLDNQNSDSSKNRNCSLSALQSNIFPAQKCPNTNYSSGTIQSHPISVEISPPSYAVKEYENSDAEFSTGAYTGEKTIEVTSQNISNEFSGVPQGISPTTLSSNEIRTNHAMTSLEKTLELVKKRKSGLSEVEATSIKNTKRKRKSTKPAKSIEYCKESETLDTGNLSSTASIVSSETDEVTSMEAGCSTLGNEQFSLFSTQHMHFLLNFKRYECLKCGQEFASKKAMNVHVQTHSKEKPFWCIDCGQGFTDDRLYEIHRKLHRPYIFDDCGTICADTDSTTLHNHELFPLESKNFQCSLCPKVFKQPAGLACHRMNAHPDTSNVIKPFWCTECNKGFTQNHSYKAHLRIHSGERPYLCKECGAAFADNKTLQNHKALHSDEKTFKCTLCPKMFRQRAGLACHMKTHTDEKPFACELCGQRVKTKATLKNHQRIHFEEKPYQCPLCPQAFKQRAGLACHSKVHEKGNPV